MSSTLKYVLLAVGGYLLFKELKKRGALGFIPPPPSPHPHGPPPPPPPPAFPDWYPPMYYPQAPIILQMPADMRLPSPDDFGIDGVPVKKKTKKKKKVEKDEDEDEE